MYIYLDFIMWTDQKVNVPEPTTKQMTQMGIGFIIKWEQLKGEKNGILFLSK